MLPAKTSLIAGALFGAAGVVLGAWGAHGLAAYLGSNDTGAWDTAVLYQLVHALALLAIGMLMLRHENLPLKLSAWSLMAGILLFSGSIYALVLGAPRWMGPVTPLGGVAFIFGWLALAVGVWRTP